MQEILPVSAYRKQGRFSPTLFVLGGAVAGPLFGLARVFSITPPAGPIPTGEKILMGGLAGGVLFGLLLWVMFRLLLATMISRAYAATYRGFAAAPPENGAFTHRLPATLSDKTHGLGKVGGVLYAGPGRLVFSPHTAILHGGRGFVPVPLGADTPLRADSYLPLPQWISYLLGSKPLETLEIGAAGAIQLFQVPEAETVAAKLREVVLGATG
jgi:hypothetical protein